MKNIEITYANFDFKNAAYQISNAKMEKAVNKIIASTKSKDPLYQIFSYENALEQAESCSSYAREINANFTDLIVISMGGASLNPETLISFFTPNDSPTRIHFLNNTDQYFLHELLEKISLKQCAILAISNSGKTLETIALVGVMISEFEKANIDNFGKHFYFITNINSGDLKNIANKIDATLIEHTANISGRFSGLTNVNSLIAQVAGIKVNEYLLGAKLAFEKFQDNKFNSQAALSACAIYTMGMPIIVNIGYLQKFNIFLEWYSQIIAESLGKDGAGLTPIRGLGPNDQHSMLQLYLDGPADKIYNLFYIENSINLEYTTSNLEELGYVAGQNLHDINTANFKATMHALIEKGAPTKSTLLKEISPSNIGELIIHSMLEVVILCHMMELNPFNQPGVELIKKESENIIRNNLISGYKS